MLSSESRGAVSLSETLQFAIIFVGGLLDFFPCELGGTDNCDGHNNEEKDNDEYGDSDADESEL